MARLLSCPHCGLTKTAADDERDLGHCPRCLARSGGALSVYLSEPGRGRTGATRTIAERLLRLGRGGQWVRS